MQRFDPVRLAFLLGFLLAAVLSGCQGERGPTAPTPRPETITVNGVDLLVGDLHGGRGLAPAGDDDPCSSSGSGQGNCDLRYVERTNGGQLQIEGAELRISKSSVNQSAWIFMQRSPDTFGVWTITFDPSGLTFNPQAALTIEVDEITGIDPTRLRIAGASSTAEDWTVLGGTYDPDRGTLSIKVPHFSRYALCVVQ